MRTAGAAEDSAEVSNSSSLNAALLPRLTPEQEERSQWEDDTENQVHHLSTLDNDHKDKDDGWMQMIKI